MKRLKDFIDDYNLPTPKKMRRIGDGLLAASTFASGYAIATDHSVIAGVIIFIGVVGKFITNFYKEEPGDQTPKPGAGGSVKAVILLLLGSSLLVACCTSQKTAERRIARMVDCNPGLKDAFKDTVRTTSIDTFIVEEVKIQRDTILSLDTVEINQDGVKIKIAKKKTGTPCDTIKTPVYVGVDIEPDTIIQVKEVKVPCPGGIEVTDRRIPWIKRLLWYALGFISAFIILVLLRRGKYI